ncbi:MAG: AAA family ATPase [Clostridia bacterium]|nr:AAA family ATPase [Clostridia bacterium]
MREDKYLILINGEDKTSEVIRWKKTVNGGLLFITFQNKKSYPYRTQEIVIRECIALNPVSSSIVLKNGEEVRNVVKICDFGVFSKLFYVNGRTELSETRNIQLITSALDNQKASNCFEYFKDIAKATGLVVDGTNILSHRYERISFIRSDSILAAFLSGHIDSSRESSYTERRYPYGQPIYPFGFNISQKKAVENAMDSNLSVIQGPPGTGKTQTILNIIANAVMRGEKVAVVSGNNTATANVLEKLKQYGIDFICAPLGNSENKEAFIENQSPGVPDFQELTEYSSYAENLGTLEGRIEHSMELKNELSALSGELDSLKKEYSFFKDFYNEKYAANNLASFADWVSAGSILAISNEIEYLNSIGKKPRFFRRLVLKFIYELINVDFNNLDCEAFVASCRNAFYVRRIPEIESKIKKIEVTLKSENFTEINEKYRANALKAFKAFFARKYSGVSTRKTYTAEDLWRQSAAFMNDYPVVLSTTYSLSSSLSDKVMFGYVIVDEASQVDIVTGALALSCAKKAVIVGDLKQLPNVVTDTDRTLTDGIFSDYSLSEAYRYSTNSLLSSVVSLFPNTPQVLLREHYRCNPEIIGFCNQRFYNGELIVLTEDKKNCRPMMIYRTAPGNHARQHYNQRQIDVILNEVIPQQHLDVSDSSMGIVTPYRNQALALKEAFKGTSVKAETADKFQGQERKVMIFSTVDNEIGDFASDPNRLNVAVSRAVEQFIVVTDGNDNDFTSPIHDLIGYIIYNNHETVDSAIRSVFDNLYSCNEEKRQEVLKKYGRHSEYESENLVYAMINEVLSCDEFSKYKAVMHVPMNMLISDFSRLGGREIEYATNPLTHVDFLIYSKITHRPVLAVEVDGFNYHKTAKQAERDLNKNSILEKYNLPLLRLSTVGSGESEKLAAALLALENAPAAENS